MRRNSSPTLEEGYFLLRLIKIRGLEKEYCTVMGMLYMMTRLGTAKKVTPVFEQVMGKNPRTFQQFVQKNIAFWQ